MESLAGRASRALAPWVALALLQLGLAAGAPGGDEGGPAEQIGPILEDARQPGSAAAAARRLAALGAPAAPALVETLAGGRLSGDQREALLGGLALIDRTAVFAELERLAAAPAPKRRAVLAVLGRVGHPDDLELALQAAFPDPAGAAAPSLDGELAAAVGAILARHPDGAARIPPLVAAAETPVRTALVRGVGSSGRREGIAVLAALFRAAPELERSLVGELGRLAAPLAPPFAAAALAEVRARLDSPDRQLAREAVLTAGRLVDDAALPRLVELLDDPEEPIAEAALYALRSITGLSLPADRARWQAWLEAEQAWFDTELAPTLARLLSRDPAQVQAGLRQLSLRRLRRLELAGEVDRLLRAADADVCRAACQTLAALGACAQLGSLIDCLEDDDGPVAAEAWRTLQLLTGADLPADAGAWRASWGKSEAVVRRSAP